MKNIVFLILLFPQLSYIVITHKFYIWKGNPKRTGMKLNCCFKWNEKKFTYD